MSQVKYCKTIGWGALAALYRSSAQIQTQHGMSSVSNAWLYPSNGHRQLALLRILRQDAFNLHVWGSQEEQHVHFALLPRKSGALGWISGNCRSAKIAGSGVRSIPWSIGQLGAVDQQVRRSWVQWLGGALCQSLNAKTAPFPSCLFNPCKTTTTWWEWDDLFRFQPFCEVFLSQRGDVFALE